MKKKCKFLGTILLVACLMFSTTCVQAATKDEVDSLKQQAEDASNNVSNIKGQKQEAESQKANLESQATDLSKTINDLNNQISDVTSDINDTEANITDVQADIDLLEEQLEITMDYLDVQKSSMRLRIQYMYENRTTNNLVALLESGSISELLSRLEYMAQITSYDQDAIEKFEETQASLEDTQAQIEEKKSELVSYQDSLTSQKNKLGGLVSTTATALGETNNQITQSEATIADLEQQLADAEAYEATIQQQYMEAQAEYAAQLAGERGAYDGSYSSTDEEVLLLAALIQAEAANQGDAGRLAVGAVVMNRVYSSKFPSTVAGVIYQSNQFAPVTSGRVALILASGPNSACQYAAAQALAGVSNTDALFFCTYTYAQALHDSQVANGQVGFLDRTEGVTINAHYFYNYK